MQFAETSKPPVGIVFDSDMGENIDAALALALLYGFDSKNECRVASLSVSRPSLQAAAYCEVMARFFAGNPTGPAAMFARVPPIGMTDGKAAPESPMLAAVLSRKNDEGKPVYVNSIHKLNDTAEPRALIRNAFTAQHDQNCAVVLAGPATNLAAVLDLPGAKEWAERKVRVLVFNATQARVKGNVAAAKRLFAEWPTPIVVVGDEIGAALPYPAASIEKDFAYTTTHPVVDAYRTYKPMPYDAPTGAMAAALYTVRPQEGYFKASEPGTITVSDDGQVRFAAAAQGRHRQLTLDPAQKERIIKVYTEVASVKPVARVPRFLQQQQKKEPEKKAPEQKAAEPKPTL